MKHINFKILLATVALWCSIVTAQAQTGVFRVKNGIPHLPVVANFSTVPSPRTGALVYSTSDSNFHLYTGTGWDSFCSESLPGVTNSATYFRVVNGIPCLPVQDPLTGAATSGAIAFQKEVGLKINNGTAWKSVADINQQTNSTANSATAMGNIPGAPGGFTIPVLTTAPTGIENGAFYIDATTGSLKIYYNSWLTLPDCNCPPQATNLYIGNSSYNSFYAAYTYFDNETDLEDTPIIKWWRSDDEDGKINVINMTGAGDSVNYASTLNYADHYLHCSVTPKAKTGTIFGSKVNISKGRLVKNCLPQVSAALVETFDNKLLNASYVYYDRESDFEDMSPIQWQVAAQSDYADSHDATGQTFGNFILPTTYTDKYVRFSVTAKSNSTYNKIGPKIYSDWYEIDNCEPQAFAASVNGIPAPGYNLTAGYMYYDKNSDIEGATTIAWYYCNSDGSVRTPDTPISEGTSQSYLLENKDVGKYIQIEVKPKALTGYHKPNGSATYASSFSSPVLIQSCPTSIYIQHNTTDLVSPVNEGITYGVEKSAVSGSDKCWITRNLGATSQTSGYNDLTDESMGWFWQFGQKKGYSLDTKISRSVTSDDVRTPSTAWNTSVSLSTDWPASTDPCTVLMGHGWRLPTKDEWVTTSSSWTGLISAYQTLQIHAPGYLSNMGVFNYSQEGHYSCSTLGVSAGYCYILEFVNGSHNIVNSNFMSEGSSVRCIKDIQ